MIRNDMAFRPALMALCGCLGTGRGARVRPSDGFFLINELSGAAARGYPPEIAARLWVAVNEVAGAIQQPIQYAGPGTGESSPTRGVCDRCSRREAVGIPGTLGECVVVGHELWDGFLDLSLWVEALSIHEWSLFTESVTQPGGSRRVAATPIRCSPTDLTTGGRWTGNATRSTCS